MKLCKIFKDDFLSQNVSRFFMFFQIVKDGSFSLHPSAPEYLVLVYGKIGLKGGLPVD